jgi:hypothetical protein
MLRKRLHETDRSMSFSANSVITDHQIAGPGVKAIAAPLFLVVHNREFYTSVMAIRHNYDAHFAISGHLRSHIDEAAQRAPTVWMVNL